MSSILSGRFILAKRGKKEIKNDPAYCLSFMFREEYGDSDSRFETCEQSFFFYCAVTTSDELNVIPFLVHVCHYPCVICTTTANTAHALNSIDTAMLCSTENNWRAADEHSVHVHDVRESVFIVLVRPKPGFLNACKHVSPTEIALNRISQSSANTPR